MYAINTCNRSLVRFLFLLLMFIPHYMINQVRSTTIPSTNIPHLHQRPGQSLSLKTIQILKPIHQNQIPLLQLLTQRHLNRQPPHLLIQLRLIILHRPLRSMRLRTPPPMRRAAMPRTCGTPPFLWSYLPPRSGDFGYRLGAGSVVAEATFFVPLVDDAAVENVDADWVLAEYVGGEVDCTYFFGGVVGVVVCVGGGQLEDWDVEAIGEGDGVDWFPRVGQIVHGAVDFIIRHIVNFNTFHL
mmetsp:Transcript_15315/g.18142  ORF Transcript_15315/g.18142 Transcript_15315/m.18142 type:complete len:242 (-) Transcript_15315:465-1190(-)